MLSTCVEVVLEVVGATEEVVVDGVVDEVVLEVVGDMEVVVVMDGRGRSRAGGRGRCGGGRRWMKWLKSCWRS